MNSTVHCNVARYPRPLRWFMGILWAVIAVKCVLVWWASAHWDLPHGPLWVLAPTHVLVIVVTAAWLTHRSD